MLATGGGAVLAEEKRNWLKARGIVVYLRATLAQQLERTGRDKTRPLLQTPDPVKKIKEIMEIREPLYLDVADIIVDTNSRNPRSVGKEVGRQINIYLSE